MDFFDQPNRQIAAVLLGVIYKPLLQGRTIDRIQFAAVQIHHFRAIAIKQITRIFFQVLPDILTNLVIDRFCGHPMELVIEQC